VKPRRIYCEFNHDVLDFAWVDIASKLQCDGAEQPRRLQRLQHDDTAYRQTQRRRLREAVAADKPVIVY
jgi:hypothetical protein